MQHRNEVNVLPLIISLRHILDVVKRVSLQHTPSHLHCALALNETVNQREPENFSTYVGLGHYSSCLLFQIFPRPPFALHLSPRPSLVRSFPLQSIKRGAAETGETSDFLCQIRNDMPLTPSVSTALRPYGVCEIILTLAAHFRLQIAKNDVKATREKVHKKSQRYNQTNIASWQKRSRCNS